MTRAGVAAELRRIARRVRELARVAVPVELDSVGLVAAADSLDTIADGARVCACGHRAGWHARTSGLGCLECSCELSFDQARVAA